MYEDVVSEEISTPSNCTNCMNGKTLFHGQKSIGSMLQVFSKKILSRLGLNQTITYLLLRLLFTEADE